MRQKKVYCGELGDGTLSQKLPELIKEARDNQESFYVLWNGFLLYIDQYSTVQECIDDYNEQVKRDGFYAGFKNGEYIKTDDLGKKIAKIFASL